MLAHNYLSFCLLQALVSYSHTNQSSFTSPGTISEIFWIKLDLHFHHEICFDKTSSISHNDQGFGVGDKISDSDSNSDFSRISHSDSRLRHSKISDAVSRLWPFQNFRLCLLNIKGWNLAVTIHGNGGIQKSLFQQKVKKKFTILTEIPNLGVLCKKWSNWTSGVGVGQKIWLRLLVLLGIRLRLHLKTSDSLRFRLRLQFRNPDND